MQQRQQFEVERDDLEGLLDALKAEVHNKEIIKVSKQTKITDIYGYFFKEQNFFVFLTRPPSFFF